VEDLEPGEGAAATFPTLTALQIARIAPFARGALDDAEITKPHDLHFTALLQRRSDGIEGRIDGS